MRRQTDQGLSAPSRRRLSPAVWRFILPVLLIAACASVTPVAPPDPWASLRRWGETVKTYRYDRTTIIYGTNGPNSIIHESGAVIRPDRQHVRIESNAGGRVDVSEILIIGDRVWTRPVAVGRDWQPMAAGQLPHDPLTVLLDTLAAAGPPRALGQRYEDGRYCDGFDVVVDLSRVPSWPVTLAGPPNGQASIWRQEDGTACGQTIRLQRDDRPTAEYTLTFAEIGSDVIIEAPRPQSGR